MPGVTPATHPPHRRSAIRSDPAVVTLQFVELAGAGEGPLQEAVVELQGRWFGEYDYALDDVRANASLPALRDGIVHHQRLVLVDDEVAGYIVFHTNLRRRVGLGHFMAVDPTFRGRGIAKALEYHAIDVVVDDGRAHSTELLAYVGEMERHMVPVFETWGFVAMPVDYAEPYHGASWPDFGEPTFFDRVLMAHPLPGVALDIPAVAHAGSAAFLIDHYRLPHDHPVVLRCLGSNP